MKIRDRIDPFIAFQFSIKVDGGANPTGFFTEVDGLGSEHDVIEHKVVDENGQEVVHMMPGRLKWNPVTLKRGITTDMSFWEWRRQVVEGDLEGARANSTISMHDPEGNIVAEWTLDFTWPSKITGPTMKTDSNEFGLEEITIVHEGMRRTL